MPTAPFLAPERDDSFKVGRPDAAALDFYYVPGVTFTGASAAATILTADQDWYAPFYCDTPTVIDRLAFNCTALVAATNARVGIYAATVNWQPIGGPLLDSGDISTATTGIKTYDPSTPLYLPRGRYLTVINSNGAPSIFRYPGALINNGPQSSFGASGFAARYTVTRTYAAFPNPGTAWTAVDSGSDPCRYPVLMRVPNP